MSYSKFTLEEVLTNFNLNMVEKLGKFNQLPEVSPSKFIQEALEYYLPYIKNFLQILEMLTSFVSYRL
ncbi:MAG: hypothetical protein F6K17_06885 [Okeania sp. SIO3C4]|nr:hypothetical protein [Okeania sp. SIO3B3]NER02375.1 hypothetical protein [Okeania sp. SIO3C4]